MAIRPNNAADPEVATVGEDGKLVFSRFENGAVESIGRRLVDLYQGFPLVHADADAMVINDVAWATTDQIIVASSGGQLKTFDRRQTQKPTATLVEYVTLYIVVEASGYRIACFRSSHHYLPSLSTPHKRQGRIPSAQLRGRQLHPGAYPISLSYINKIATGNEDGGVTVWDLRNLATHEARNHKVHDSHGTRFAGCLAYGDEIPVWELMFHPDDSNKIVSCSEGTLLSSLLIPPSFPSGTPNNCLPPLIYRRHGGDLRLAGGAAGPVRRVPSATARASDLAPTQPTLDQFGRRAPAGARAGMRE
ncbi:hypothetical protein BC938DRAFT_470683 [Jimgerdemannia flammicorona]|uniref:WD40-repeat-containing domain protein n=1 Tax=Jimgerdemannia flammicorona TaxID=994334 RepID=A0A433QV32_9FUNG|nr:hypothetical protein BC938DRAFT_470683 [Jimgerdemannia flammicorona]